MAKMRIWGLLFGRESMGLLSRNSDYNQISTEENRERKNKEFKSLTKKIARRSRLQQEHVLSIPSYNPVSLYIGRK